MNTDSNGPEPSPSHRLPTARAATVAAVLSLGAALAALAYLGWRLPIKSDDAFITFRVARNLADGAGMVYNPGERVQVSSTPLYCLLLAASRRATGCDITTASRFWEFLALAADIALLCWIATAAGYGRWIWLIPLLAVAEPVVVFLSKGMESAVFMAFILGALIASGRERPLWSAAMLAGAVLTRLDGLILAPILAARRLKRLVAREETGREWLRTCAAQLAIFAAITLPWFLFAWFYFGNPLPVTIGHKLAQTRRLGLAPFGKSFLEYFLWDHKADLPYLRTIPFVVGMVALAAKARPRFPIVEWWLFYLVVYIAAGMPIYLWYQFPLYLPAAAIIAVGFAEAARRAVNLPKPATRNAAALALAALGGAVAFQAAEPWPFIIRTAEAPAPSPLRDTKRYSAVGRRLAQTTRPDALVAAHEVGMIGYYSRRKILDLTGLTTPLAEDEMRLNPLEIVLRRRADCLVIEKDIYESYPEPTRRRFEKRFTEKETFDDPYAAETVLVFFRESARGNQ